MLSALDREHSVAPPGFSRWLIPPAALSVHLCIGQVYATSVYKNSLIAHFNVSQTAIGIMSSGDADKLRKASVNNLKRIALAVMSYADDHRGQLPADVVDKDGKPILSWRVLILPYLEESRQPSLTQQDYVSVPVGLTLFPKDMSGPPPDSITNRTLNVLHRNEMLRGSHFTALEEPELFVNELEAFLASTSPEDRGEVRP